MPSELYNPDVRERLAGSKGLLEIIFHPASDEGSSSDRPLADAARQVEAASDGALRVQRGDGAGLVGRPCLTIAHSGLGRIHYLAVPDGPEAPPFVEALLGPDPEGAPPAWAKQLSALARPADLVVFVAIRLTMALALLRKDGRHRHPWTRETIAEAIDRRTPETYLRHELHAGLVLPAMAHKVDQALLRGKDPLIRQVHTEYLARKIRDEAQAQAQRLLGLAEATGSREALLRLSEHQLDALFRPCRPSSSRRA